MRASQSKITDASKQNCVAIYTSISVFRAQAFLSFKAASISEFDMSGEPSGCPAIPIFFIEYFSNKPDPRICIVLWYGPDGLSNPPAIIKTSSTFARDVRSSRDCSSAFELSKLRAAKWGIGLKPSS